MTAVYASVVGLDLSLTGTGFAVLTLDHVRGEVRKNVGYVPTAPAEGIRGTLDRFRKITDRLMNAVPYRALVVIEGPSYGSATAKSGKSHERGGLWWNAADILVNGMSCDMRVAAPSTLKQYTTGRGNARKAEVVAWAARAFPEVTLRQDDVADALGLAAIGARLAGWPVDGDVTAKQADALLKVSA